ncbi:MAG: acyl-CoA dehydrogenase family protein [Bacteroidia bacterium]|nr:acyl-CoA dehydrogenase family protein [Bacteroidia bacterium]
MQTHQVFNQPGQVSGNLLELDSVLKSILQQANVSTANYQAIETLGEILGSTEWIRKGFWANHYSPVFHSHSVIGERINEVEFHPAYHEIMNLAISQGLHSIPWETNQPKSHLIRLALYYFHAQNEAGSGCPITMTFSSVPPLKRWLPQANEWIPKIISRTYQPENRPFFEKTGLTIGMAMTEKQGGTDVQANTTVAKPFHKRGTGEPYYLTGHKWFCSAPMCDAFLTLAQTEKGLSCFLLPRWWEDGTLNTFQVQRLKNKLGNRSNASSEIELYEAKAWLVGEEGRGVPTIIEMVALTRYDCMIGSSALMRRALSEVLYHIPRRKVLGKFLAEHPLMQSVVADLCLEQEAALRLTTRTAIALENSLIHQNPTETLILRILTPVGKYWITKRAAGFLAEAMECLGGNGYVEDNILPRLYREAPVNAIWEGSGNVQCLDVLRAIQKTPAVLDALLQNLSLSLGKCSYFDRAIEKLKQYLLPDKLDEWNARKLTEHIALCMQASCMLEESDPQIAEAFCETRLGEEKLFQYGNWKNRLSVDKILKFHNVIS